MSMKSLGRSFINVDRIFRNVILMRFVKIQELRIDKECLETVNIYESFIVFYTFLYDSEKCHIEKKKKFEVT